MPQFEYEFSNQDRQLAVNQQGGTFGEADYIRLTIYPTEAIDDIVTLPNTDKQAIFYSSLNPIAFDINISPFGIGTDIFDTYTIGGVAGENDFKIYKNGDDVYIKPNEIFNEFELPQGSYKIQIDFLNQLKATPPPLEDDSPPPVSDSSNHYQFIIKQISTSRKEVRLKLLNKNIVKDSETITNLTGEFNNFENEFLADGSINPNYKYQFKHILNTGTGDHNPIMNYQFDAVTDGKENQSIILKLYDVLSTNVTNLSMVTIEKEVLTTQTEDIYYFSDVPEVNFGDGLLPDNGEDWINNDGGNVEFENYNQLSSSLGNIVIDNLISGSEYNYPNLNTDFRFFENHTFFGSAKRKLENFQNKIKTIQGHYSEISKSLYMSGVAITGDSISVTQTRKNSFNKINKEIKSFTPYEHFLYYDGQNESTASAPGLGKNYADTIPVNNDSGQNSEYVGALNGGDGFDVVYHHKNSNSKFQDLFTRKYHIQNKPFFNHSGSVYLSFLLKGDSGSAIYWGNNNLGNTYSQESTPIPKDALHQANILNPNITSSAYQRYIFEASQSYWIPTTNDGDIGNLSYTDFNAGSTKIQIISGSTKQGSNKILDSTGRYPTTVVSSSAGIPFFGSVMPSGELFRIFTLNTLSSSLSGSWNLDSQTSAAAVTNVMLNDFSGRGNSGSIEGTPTIGDGVISRGRQYGKSFLFQSESNEGVRFFSDNDFNYTRDDNFSLSVWAKRFHSNTGSADPSAGTGAQQIFTRGAQETSYGIDYDFVNNRIRAGVRPDSGIISAFYDPPDDLLDWHHLVFTFESGSATGIKLYVDGDLKSTKTTTGPTYRITGSNAFSSSVATIGSESDVLSIGGNNVLGGSSRYYNGFVQYPRVYNRTITQAEVSQLYLVPDAITDTKITDVKISLTNPSDVLPFDNLYHTTSANWTNWYNDMLTKAENFDTDNIHSLENNLPLYIQNSGDYNDMKDFLLLQGEQYDLIRNHIDSLGTLHNRGYKKTNSPPENTYPILLNNMGWEAINPFSVNLNDSLGNYLTNVTSIDDIKNNTWRKTLNNLLYIYKSKGTQNSVRALLNTYGYPPDVLQFQEFGGATQNNTDTQEAEAEADSEIILDDQQENPVWSNSPPPPVIGDDVPIDLDLSTSTGSIGFTTNKQKLYRYIVGNNSNKVLALNWWMNSADIDTIEFVYKHKQTVGTQTILKSSGSGVENLWDLRLVPSVDGVSSSFAFRLNNSQVADTAIGNRAFSMSLAYNKILDGQLWNVMLQRMTSSAVGVGAGINEYRLHAALQENTSIKTYSYATMSVSGGLIGGTSDGGKGFFANQNFNSSGSKGTDIVSSSGLYVGETVSGSLTEIKAWTTALSISRFRQHTLNKFSTVGNSINSHCEELVYHYKLNENFGSASISQSVQNLTIVDSAAKINLIKDYSISKAGTFFTDTPVYGFDYIDVVKFSITDNNLNTNNNNIIINPSQTIVGNLSPNNSAVDSLTNPKGKKPSFKTSEKLEIYRSPQNYVNDYILNNLDGFSFEKYYGNPKYQYSSSYTEFDTFRKDFFNCHPIEVDTNKFIRAHENMFNQSIIDGIKSIVPARSTFSGKNSNIGVEIKPTILERQKYENEQHSVETNPNTATGSISVILVESIMTGSIVKLLPSGSASVVSVESIMTGSTVVLAYSASIGRGYVPFGTPNSISSSLTPSTTGSLLVLPKSGSILPSPSLTGSTVVLPYSGSIDYSAHSNKSFENIHDNWGSGHTTGSNTHFINYAAGLTEISFTTASISFEFIQSASNNSTFNLISLNDDKITNTTRTYEASASFTNGTIATGGNILFSTGSGATIGAGSSSVAGNLLAAITSSNGHGTRFIVSQPLATSGKINITQSVSANRGNTTLTVNNKATSSLTGNLGSSLSINFSGGAGDIVNSDYNNLHIDTRFHFISIGDSEIYSGSYDKGSFNYTDFSNQKRFYNRQMISSDFHSDIIYESLISGNPGNQTGRMIGKTRYFSASADGGTLTLPANHVSKFSYPFKEQMYKGAQNRNPGILNFEKDDYATASFYRVTVTGGENQIIVQGNKDPKLDSGDKIIY